MVPSRWWKNGLEPPTTLRFLAEAVPPLSFKSFHIMPRVAITARPLDGLVEHAGYRLGWDEHGIRSLVTLATGQELLNQAAGPAGELLLEGDIGDPWSTRSLERPRTSCGKMTRLLGAYQHGDVVEVSFAGSLENGSFGDEIDPCVFGLEWYLTVRLLSGLPWVEFDLEVFWQTVNRRLRVAFPPRATTDSGWYKIPYGVLNRARYEMTETRMTAPNGDWAATYFAATAPTAEAPGLAVINTGTPSARIEDGVLLYSILRAPGFGHCLHHYAQEYPMPLSGMGDGGHHTFRFAVLPFTTEAMAQVLETGYLLNTPVPAYHLAAGVDEWRSGLGVAEAGVYLSAVKPRYDGTGIAVRLLEQLGQAREVCVSVPARYTRAFLANLLEEPQEALPIHHGQITLPVTPYMLRTIVLE